MDPAQFRDGGRLLGTALGEIADLSQDVHRAVSSRVFGLLGPIARPVRLMHDAIATISYGSSGLGVRAIPALVGSIAAERVRAVASAPSGNPVQSALNGFWGDRIAVHHASLAPQFTLRTHAGPLRRDPANLAHDLADPTGRLVIFVHGLCENDRLWRLGATRHWGDPSVTYGSLLHDEQGWTPMYAHYNTGLAISTNARLLAERIDALVAGWPVDVTEIALVGHSMGGLIARTTAEHEHAWTGRLTHVVGLGTPHLGAPLERWVDAGTRAMSRLPETRPFATWLDRRSVGIKDLRHGSPAQARIGVRYSMVSATLSSRPDGLFAHDLLVDHPSAHASGRRGAIEFDRLFHIGGRHHFNLLNDPLVYACLREWLSTIG